jgi:hypothetical protein
MTAITVTEHVHGFLMLIWQRITAQLFCLARSIRDYGYGYTPGLRAVTSQRQLPAAAMKAIMGKRSPSAISSDPRQQEKKHFPQSEIRVPGTQPSPDHHFQAKGRTEAMH